MTRCEAPSDVEQLVAGLPGDANLIHPLVALLHCARVDVEREAARALADITLQNPHLVQPGLRRMLRVAAATEDETLRKALGEALPRLQLGRGEAGRLAFVFEAWLEHAPPQAQRDAMDALVALIPQRPELAQRVRAVIERRAALGSPSAARHGMALLAGLREF